MRSINLAFDPDYLYEKQYNKLFKEMTCDYLFKCDNYAVAYQLLSILDKVKFCEHSEITDDYTFPYSWFIFITCLPEDIDRIRCVAKRIPSLINANIKIYGYNEENGYEVEV